MGHTFLFNHLHVIFSTKHRKCLITDELAERINPYLIGIARQNKFRIVEIGGTDDHIHMLLDLPGTMPISKAVQLLKAGSSKWISETFPNRRLFAWQPGYAGFTIGASQLQICIRYIQNQREHHGKIDFAAEMEQLFRAYGVGQPSLRDFLSNSEPEPTTGVVG